MELRLCVADSFDFGQDRTREVDFDFFVFDITELLLAKCNAKANDLG